MADKQKTESLQITLENGALNVETVHPKAGEVFKSNQLAEINWFFTMLANKMGLKGKSSVTRLEESPPELLVDGEMVEMPNSIVLPPQQLFVYRGKSRNGEETEFSHNKFLPGMPFELTVVTTKTVTAKAKGGRELTPETLSKPFGKDVRAAMDTAGIDNLSGVTAVSETVRVLTLARVEWFPGIFEGSGTTYQISRIIRSETTRVITFAGLTGQITEKKEISIAGGTTKPNKALSDFDKMFADMPELNPVLASQAVLIPVDELELSDQRPQLVTGRQGVSKFEPVEKPQVQPQPEEELKPESDGEPEVKPEPEEEPAFEQFEELKVELESEEKPEPESVEELEVKPEPEEESKPESVKEPEVELESEEKPKLESVDESEIKPESKEEPEFERLEELEVKPESEKGPKPESVEEPEVEPEPEEELKPELVEESEVKAEFEEESKPEPAEELQFSIQDLQRMFDQLVSQVSEPVQEKIPETVWPFEPVIVHSEPEQMIPKPEICQAVVVPQPVLEAAEVPTPADQLQTELQCTSLSRVSDRMVDDILGDLDMLITESSSQSYGRHMLPEPVQTKAVHNFFRLEKKHKK